MDENRKKVENVITGNVEVPTRKKVKDAFMKNDAKTIRDYAFFDVFIPSVKRTIYDLVTRIFGMALFGDRNSGGTSFSGTDYARPYQQVSYRNNETVIRPYGSSVIQSNNRPLQNNGYEYESWVFDNRGDIEAVLNQMTDIIERYGVASIVDLYDSVGKTAPYTADNFGWKSMNGCESKLCSGGWRLSMTRPSPIK